MASRIYYRQRRKRDDDAGPSTMPRNSPSPSSAPIESTGSAGAQIQSLGLAVQPMIPTQPPFQMMPAAFPSPFMYPNPYMFHFPSPMAGWSQWPGSAPFPVMPSGPPIYRPATHEGSQEGPSGSSSFYQSPPPYGCRTGITRIPARGTTTAAG
ncbi:hypothetical protein Gotur_010197, partial [Gossypium turneri]